MTPNVLTASPTTTLGEALRMTREHNIRHLPIVDDGKLLGIITDRDLRLAAPPVWASETDYAELRQMFEKKTVADVMTSHAIISTTEDTPIEDAARLLYEHRIGCVPVMRGDELVGILTETDVLRSFVELFGKDDSSARIEVSMPNRAGELSRIVRAISIDFKLNITGMVVPPIAGGQAIAILHIQTNSPTEIIEYLRKIGYRVGSPALDLEPESAHKRERVRVQHWGADGGGY
ncbi:MAG TPA: CBS and ACT domain-containing protein [Longimicrobiales bacterium]|nr:CBS and ACT domain-containing protein [Longimicrobiales bacterium]